MNTKVKVALWTLSVAILLLLLFFPGGSDVYIFSIGGKMLLSGLTPYKDFIDSKPPGIFGVYALIHAIFGSALVGIRIFDILYHCLTLIVFYELIRRYTNNTAIAMLSMPIYAVWYVSMGIWDTAQSESFALLPTLIIVALVQYSITHSSNYKKATYLGLVCGLLCVVLMSLKFTLVYVLLCALFVLLWKHPSKRYSSVFLTMSFVVVGVSVILFYQWLLVSGGYDNFNGLMDWLRGYSSSHPLSDYRTIITVIFVRFTQSIITLYSPTFILFGVAGILATMISRSGSIQKREITFDSVFRTHLLLQLAIGLLTVLLERKNIRYHFARSFWALTPFVAAGIVSAFFHVQRQWSTRIRTDKLSRITQMSALILLIIGLLLGTPIIKVVSEAGSYALRGVTGYETTAYTTYSEVGKEAQLREVEEFLRSNLKTHETFFLWGTIISPYTNLNIFPPTIMMINLQLGAPWTPHVLRKKVIAQLNEKRPRYFIVQSGDFTPDLSATTDDSFGMLIDWHELFDFLDMNYEEKLTLENFLIYEYSEKKAAESAAF